jgi:hypothetical protein
MKMKWMLKNLEHGIERIVCPKAFAWVYGVSKRTVNALTKDVKEGRIGTSIDEDKHKAETTLKMLKADMEERYRSITIANTIAALSLTLSLTLSLRYRQHCRCAIAALSLRYRCAIAALSLTLSLRYRQHYRCAIAAPSLRYRCAIAALSLTLSLRYR